ncbi:electron transport complex subunit RsxE [Victivallis vadensis]|uniref:Ion-translocating oxidoreductase complex subunit E n=1 Tax=Victivallis vadensis TaxID=172901 RepID=A0A2U1B7C9_9BACT|nr:electron transport complex subunit E [Victivallis vadensis]NMD86173.1 electron transport complex subunit E [Victivallis vadensis]PVY44583.1 electron transport complex protein RnfE [Victivallis vadensis]PWM80159.1 MAG: electron transport complex subunit RsxE [Lentisphaerota bacterium]HJH04848.1 electron transport complex subunit E [Victivallis vadensis]
MGMLTDFTKGIWKENPVLVLLLGTCPTLALTNSAVNGFGMGVATTFVLAGSNLVISLIAGIVPKKIRIPVYIVVIATFVTVIDMLMKAYAPQSLYQALGIFIPLIVVNCIVLGRAEAFASKNGPVRSILDGLGMGLGFTLALTMLGVIREFLTSGSVFEVKVITAWSTDFLLPSAAPGAFIIVGCILAAKNYCNRRKAIREGRLYVPPAGMDCHHCRICFTSKEGEE